MELQNKIKLTRIFIHFFQHFLTIIFYIIIFQSFTIYSFGEENKPDSLINYQVQKGDNLYLIAKKYFNQTDIFLLKDFITEIRNINEISEDNLIIPNQILKIPMISEVDSIFYHSIQHNELRGVYVNSYNLTSAKLKEITENYDSLGCNTLIVDFKNTRGDILYPTKNLLAIEIGAYKPAISQPNKLIYNLHKHNISLVARITIFKDTTLANASASWRKEWTPIIIIDSTGIDSTKIDSINVLKKIKWVNPNCKEVQKYNLEIIKEVISLGVDEIQLDYIRFPTENYLLNADYGIPDSISKQEVITNFLKSVYEITQSAGVKLSADIFGVVAMQNKQDIMNTGQHISSMIEYLDRIHPMLYPSHFYGEFWNKKYPVNEPYYFVYRTCQTLLTQIDQKEKIIPYLQAFTLKESEVNPLYIVSQLQAIKDCGLDSGYLLWNASGNYDSAWKALGFWNSEYNPQLSPSKSGRGYEYNKIDEDK
ncbi:MAG: LysM peptidoglycan-binding domain-containing protein [Candidatus Cloacimonetes bacterium]|nr:LysM peptidoglycan-binding domain-containing protein [Candidatus Cloacimonadota bacterium]